MKDITYSTTLLFHIYYYLIILSDAHRDEALRLLGCHPSHYYSSLSTLISSIVNPTLLATTFLKLSLAVVPYESFLKSLLISSIHKYEIISTTSIVP